MPDVDGVPEQLRGARLLYLGPSPGTLVSVHQPLGASSPLTGAYWDFFATLPMLLEDGPLAIYGWGGSTAARLIMEVYQAPPLLMGWELDAEVARVAQEAMGLKEVLSGGRAALFVGDALSDRATAPKGFAGIIVDLMVAGRLLPQLTEPDTWRRIRARLADPARGYVMAHLGPAADDDGLLLPEVVAALNAMAEAWGGKVLYVDPVEGSGLNGHTMALAGPPPDLPGWGSALGPQLGPYVAEWDPWTPVQVVDDLEAADVAPLLDGQEA